MEHKCFSSAPLAHISNTLHHIMQERLKDRRGCRDSGYLHWLSAFRDRERESLEMFTFSLNNDLTKDIKHKLLKAKQNLILPLSCEKDKSYLFFLSVLFWLPLLFPLPLPHVPCLFIFLTQIAVIAQRMCELGCFVIQTFYSGYSVCTKEENTID